MYIAQEHGIFAKHGLHVTIRAIQSTSDILPEMARGSIDIASGELRASSWRKLATRLCSGCWRAGYADLGANEDPR